MVRLCRSETSLAGGCPRANSHGRGRDHSLVRRTCPGSRRRRSPPAGIGRPMASATSSTACGACEAATRQPARPPATSSAAGRPVGRTSINFLSLAARGRPPTRRPPTALSPGPPERPGRIVILGGAVAASLCPAVSLGTVLSCTDLQCAPDDEMMAPQPRPSVGQTSAGCISA